MIKESVSSHVGFAFQRMSDSKQENFNDPFLL